MQKKLIEYFYVHFFWQTSSSKVRNIMEALGFLFNAVSYGKKGATVLLCDAINWMYAGNNILQMLLKHIIPTDSLEKFSLIMKNGKCENCLCL